MLMHKEKLCVLHVASLQDRETFEAVSRTTQVIAALGMDQVLVILETGGERPLWPGANGAEVRQLRCTRLPFVGKVRALQSEIARLVDEKILYAIHLHGARACVLGPRALAGRPIHARVLFSPHRPEAGATWTTGWLRGLVQSNLAAFECAPLAASLSEAQVLRNLLNRSAEVLPHPVSDAFFRIPRCEDPRPSILAQGTYPQAVDIVTRLCVLLNGREARVRFSWLGAVAAEGRAQLSAASVAVLDPDEAETAQSLSRAWAFMYLSSDARRPLALVQAMAAGLPCLVSDIPSHRSLIHHGETGLACASERDFLDRLVPLLRDGSQRKRLGQAARAEAARRFTWRHFERAVLRAYGFTGGEAFVNADAI